MKLYRLSSRLCMVVISLVLCCGNSSFAQVTTRSAAADTVYGFNFMVNMTKAIQEGIFLPDSDYVYVVLDQGVTPMSLVPGPSYTYAALVTNGLDSGFAYHYKYRINDSVYETVDRTATALPGVTTIKTWWNMEALNYTAFVVDMTYAVQSGIFNPSSDFVQILGTMNDWAGSPPLSRIDTTYSYFTTYTLDPGTVQQYKFRINADSTGLELLNKANRMLYIPDTMIEVVHYFNNINPATYPMIFNCNMEYYLRAAHFDPMNDYLDVAGNFNEWGQNDVLFKSDTDSVYTLVKFIDTSYVHTGPLEFKFRINGDSNTTELFGKPNRTYAFHDTINQNPNIFNAWYDDKDPSIPTRPWAYNVLIQGSLINHEFLSGIYSYEDVSGRPEDGTTFQWYRCDDPEMTNLTPIDTAKYITYTIDTLDIGRYLVFEVTPRALGGDSAVGHPVRVVSSSKVLGVGIGEIKNIIASVYPNPVSGMVTVETLKDISMIEIFNYFGQQILEINLTGRKIFSLDLSILSHGFYILKVHSRDREVGMVKIIRN